MPPPHKFRSQESYAHYYAKIILQEWLTKRWEFNQKNGYKNVFSVLEWDNPTPGIMLEYPILSSTLESGKKDILGLTSCWKEYPTLEQMNSNNLKIESTIDLVICEKGRVKYGIEIVHKHLCSAKKRAFLASLKDEHGIDFKVYEISAEWVLNQIHGYIPKIISMVRVSVNPPRHSCTSTPPSKDAMAQEACVQGEK